LLQATVHRSVNDQCRAASSKKTDYKFCGTLSDGGQAGSSSPTGYPLEPPVAVMSVRLCLSPHKATSIDIQFMRDCSRSQGMAPCCPRLLEFTSRILHNDKSTRRVSSALRNPFLWLSHSDSPTFAPTVSQSLIST
ncbi:unnamed protein product, partial [Ectocarpus sp. 4 AP-2014]